MQDLEEVYRRGVEPQLIRLLSVLPNLEAGEADAVQTVRNVSHQLKGSGSSFGHPEVTTSPPPCWRPQTANLLRPRDR